MSRRKKERSFRVGDGVGPDYVCSNCGLTGHRLWRQTNTTTDALDLLCAVCSETNQAAQIARYAEFHQDMDCTIGDLVPARPTADGDNFWGHSSGDIEWWFRLPQYKDAERDAARCRIERDHHVGKSTEYARMYLQKADRLDFAERDLRNLRTLHSDEACIPLYDALAKIRDHSRGEYRTNEGWMRAFEDVQQIARDALADLAPRKR